MIFGKAFDAFISTFKKSPIKTSVTLVAFFILVFIGSAKNLKDSEDLIEYRNLRDTTYSQQIEQLNKIENDMVIPPFLAGFKSRPQATMANFC